MQGTGEPLSDDEVSEMMKEADKDGDGRIDYEGLITVFKIFLIVLSPSFIAFSIPP